MTDKPEQFQLKWKSIAVVMIMVCASVLVTAYATGAGNGGNSIPVVIESGSGVETASYIIYKDGDYTCAKNGTTGRIDYRSSNASDVFNNALERASGSVYVTAGEYDLYYGIEFTNGSKMIGDGEHTVLNQLNNDLMRIRMHDVSDVYLGSVKIIGYHGVHIWANITGVNNITIADVTITADGDQGAFYIWSEGATVENVTYLRCSAIDCGQHGWYSNGEIGLDISLLKNITYQDCLALRCGLYNRTNDWVTGFDIAEGVDIRDVTLINCIAKDNWESGFHAEYNREKYNVQFINCQSINNGQKPTDYVNSDGTTGPQLAAGFLMSQNMTANGCYAADNYWFGFSVTPASAGSVALIGCVDSGSGFGYFLNGVKSSVTLQDCQSLNAAIYGIKAISMDHLVIDGLVVREPTGDAIGQNILGLSAAGITNSSIRMTVLSSSSYPAIYTRDLDNVTLEVYLDTKGQWVNYNPNNVDVLNSVVRTTAGIGIYVSGDATKEMSIKCTLIESSGTTNINTGISAVNGAKVSVYPDVTFNQVTAKTSGCLLFQNRGYTTVTGAVNTVTVNHGLGQTPYTVLVMTNGYGPGMYVVSSKSATQFVISFQNQPGASTWEFFWFAVM